MMEQQPNPVKDCLFEYVKNSQIIPKLISEKKFDQIADEVIQNCYDVAITMGEKEEVVADIATGLLHYLLTRSLITSQRKTELHGIELDIVIPDIKTLEKDPKKALVICIMRTTEHEAINAKISELETIQPEKNNIWLVLSEDVPTKNRSFVLSKEGGSFSRIIFEIAQFCNISGAGKFKILRV